jgi:hypothetical protein
MTYIYEELTAYDIARKLYADEYAGWSREGAQALAEYLASLAEDMGQPIELDVVALRCDYSEYASLDAYNADTRPNEPYQDLDALRDDAGTVVEFDGGIIVATF